jgi:hypothetical protein
MASDGFLPAIAQQIKAAIGDIRDHSPSIKNEHGDRCADEVGPVPGLIFVHDPQGDFGEISRRRERSLSARDSRSLVWLSVMFHGLTLRCRLRWQ